MKIKPLYVLSIPFVLSIWYTLFFIILLWTLSWWQSLTLQWFGSLLILYFIQSVALFWRVYVISFFVSSYIHFTQQAKQQNDGSVNNWWSSWLDSTSDIIFVRIINIVSLFTIPLLVQLFIHSDSIKENQTINYKNKVVDMWSKSLARIINTIWSILMLPILINTYLYLVKWETIWDRILNQRIVNNKNWLKPSLKWLLVREVVKWTWVIFLWALILFCGMLFWKLFANRLLLNESAIATWLYSTFNTLFFVWIMTSLINVCSIMLDKNRVGLHEKRTNTTVIINSI